jgi:hypothetical protein
MIGQGWTFIAIGWVVSNIVVKLLLDSVERLYKEDIASRVKQLPLKIKDMTGDIAMSMRNRMLIVLLEILRIIGMVFFLPLFLILHILPFLQRARYFKAQLQFLKTLFSRDWMVVALVMLEAFSWKGLLLCILSVFQISSVEPTNEVAE